MMTDQQRETGHTLRSPVRPHTLLKALVVGLMGMTLASCEDPTDMKAEQKGYRGTGMEQVINTDYEAVITALNAVPEPLYPPEPDDFGDYAGEVYENVQVLGDLRDAQFNRLMAHITEWVAPEQGCNYCHSEDGNFASDVKYTKIVARKMIQMTRDINANWNSHVGNVGVTCYTCHRGKNLPANYWFAAEPEKRLGVGYRAAQNRPSESVAYSSLPEDPFSPMLLGDKNIRVNSPTALPTGTAPEGGIKNTEWTYGLMMHLSQSLGVNCTYCHNSRVFADWQQSPPARATAWYGIRMVREQNLDWMVPLTDTFAAAPAGRLGPTGDVGKIYCATCHAGVNKPLKGYPMLRDHPELWGGGDYSATADMPDLAARHAAAMAEVALSRAAADGAAALDGAPVAPPASPDIPDAAEAAMPDTAPAAGAVPADPAEAVVAPVVPAAGTAAAKDAPAGDQKVGHR